MNSNEPPGPLAILLGVAAVGGLLWAVNKATKGKLQAANNTVTGTDSKPKPEGCGQYSYRSVCSYRDDYPGCPRDHGDF